MYVKLFQQILDSSIADNRPLRHFFIDLLLCSDARGYVIMTKEAIARRISAPLDEVEWGLTELSKPDPGSKTTDLAGARIEALGSMGYGWRIVNYELYRAMKDADQLRNSSAERVRRFRAKKKGNGGNVTETSSNACNAITEAEAESKTCTPPPVVKKKKSEATTDEVLSKLFEIEGFKQAWNGFQESRKRLRKPMTPMAEKLMLRKLEEQPIRAVKAVEMMIEHGWQGFQWSWMDERENGRGQQTRSIRPLPQHSKGDDTPQDFMAVMARKKREEEARKHWEGTPHDPAEIFTFSE